MNNRMSNVVLSSGSTSFPTSRPVAAFHETKLNEMVLEYSEIGTLIHIIFRKRKVECVWLDQSRCFMTHTSIRKKMERFL